MTAVYTPPGDDVFLFDEDEGEEEIAPMRVVINGPAGDGCNLPE